MLNILVPYLRKSGDSKVKMSLQEASVNCDRCDQLTSAIANSSSSGRIDLADISRDDQVFAARNDALQALTGVRRLYVNLSTDTDRAKLKAES